MGNQLFQLACQRRSIRRFTGKEIENDVIDEILKTALLAPSSWGSKPVHFIVIRDKETMKKLAACKAMGAGPVPQSSAVIVVVVDTRNCELWIEDAAVASTYILFAAEQAGVGACWVHMRDRMGNRKSSEEEIRELLGIPDYFAVPNVVALGDKGEAKRPYAENDLPLDNIHRERY